MPPVQGLEFKINEHLRAERGLLQYDVRRAKGWIEIGKCTLSQVHTIQRLATLLNGAL